MFVEYYDRFGLAKPDFLAAVPMAKGIMAQRTPAAKVSHDGAYDLTHEVFVAFDYGGQHTAVGLTPGDRVYAAEVLPELLQRSLGARDPDLAGELISCLRYPGHRASPACRPGLDYLLDNQNSNGSWGDYERYRKQFGPYLEHHVYLHTTMVVLDALLAAYEGGWAPAP